MLVVITCHFVVLSVINKANKVDFDLAFVSAWCSRIIRCVWLLLVVNCFQGPCKHKLTKWYQWIFRVCLYFCCYYLSLLLNNVTVAVDTSYLLNADILLLLMYLNFEVQCAMCNCRTIVTKPRVLAHMIRNKFGSADNISSMRMFLDFCLLNKLVNCCFCTVVVQMTAFIILLTEWCLFELLCSILT